MKKNDLILVAAVAIYSLMFYQQLAGLNFLLFSFALIVLLIIKEPKLTRSPQWLITAAGTLITGVFVFMHGTYLSIVANIVSLLLLSAMSINTRSSVLAAFIHSLYSQIASIAFMILDIIERSEKREKGPKKNIWIRSTIVLVILAIIVIMFILYQKANPLFYNFTKDINLDFISFPWIRFTLLGFILVYAFFYARTFPAFQRFDTYTPNKLSPASHELTEVKGFRKIMGIETEGVAGITLLALLNLLILSVNIIDINYLWIGRMLPEGMSIAESLHQAVGITIVSIIIAIAVLLFLFRSDMNFYKKNKTLKILAVVWMAQNIFLVLSAIYRNNLYIEEYSLTYKRIGVYVYLALTLSGIASAVIKVMAAKSNWYLFRFNGWSLYLALALIPSVNWDLFITRYNLAHSENTDIRYIFNMSYSNLPELLEYSEENDLKSISTFEDDSYSIFDFSIKDSRPISYEQLLHRRIYEFMEHNQNTGWKSLCLDKQDVESSLFEMHRSGSLTEFDLSAYRIFSLAPISDFTNVTKLNLSENTFTDLGTLIVFSDLETLDLSSNNIENVDGMPNLPNLKDLILSRNRISNFDSLVLLDSLEKLDISYSATDIQSLPAIKSLKQLNISGDRLTNFDFLEDMRSLKILFASDIKLKTVKIDQNNMPLLTIPDQMEELYLSGNNISSIDKPLLKQISELENLKVLDLSGNQISSLSMLVNKEVKAEDKFKNLKVIYVNNNYIRDLDDIRHFESLEEVYAIGNKIYSLEPIMQLAKIKAIYVESNNIKEIDVLEHMTELKTLNISDNPLSDYKKLGKIKSLNELYAKKLGIDDISFITTIENLTTLNLSDNKISDISALAKLKKLEVLDITMNPIDDFSALYKLSGLKELYLSGVDDTKLFQITKALPETDVYVNGSLRSEK